jgi:hypothetical protein
LTLYLLEEYIPQLAQAHLGFLDIVLIVFTNLALCITLKHSGACIQSNRTINFKNIPSLLCIIPHELLEEKLPLTTTFYG